eukprot:32865-Eustigmatos_ZCMA.PRE.1
MLSWLAHGRSWRCWSWTVAGRQRTTKLMKMLMRTVIGMLMPWKRSRVCWVGAVYLLWMVIMRRLKGNPWREPHVR